MKTLDKTRLAILINLVKSKRLTTAEQDIINEIIKDSSIKKYVVLYRLGQFDKRGSLRKTFAACNIDEVKAMFYEYIESHPETGSQGGQGSYGKIPIDYIYELDKTTNKRMDKVFDYEQDQNDNFNRGIEALCNQIAKYRY